MEGRVAANAGMRNNYNDLLGNSEDNLKDLLSNHCNLKLNVNRIKCFTNNSVNF
jgi:hypothetical protein